MATSWLRRPVKFSLRTLAIFLLFVTAMLGMLYRCETWGGERALDAGTFVNAVFSTEDGSQLLTCRDDGAVTIWDVRDLSRLASVESRPYGLRDMRLSLDGSRILLNQLVPAGGKISRDASGSFRVSGYAVQVIDLATGKTVFEEERVPAGSSWFYPSPDGKRIAEVNDGPLKIWNVDDGSCREWDNGAPYPIDLRWSPDGKLFACSYADDYRIHLVGAADLQERADLVGHKDTVRRLRFSRDGSLLASGGTDKTARIWDVASGASVHVLAGHGGQVGDVAFSNDNRKVATLSGGFCRVWQLPESDQVCSFEAEAYYPVQFSPDGSRVLLENTIWGKKKRFKNTGSRVTVWDSATGKKLYERVFELQGTAFLPDGEHMLVSPNGSGNVRLLRRGRPEWWWGIFCAWEFWLLLFFSGVLVWSVARDAKALYASYASKPDSD